MFIGNDGDLCLVCMNSEPIFFVGNGNGNDKLD
jgi:hypothetical protein